MEAWDEVGRREAERHEETLGGSEYVHYPDFGDGFTDVYLCQTLSSCIL